MTKATPSLAATYILPIHLSATEAVPDDLAPYLAWLAERIEVIVVDSSPAAVFAGNHASWPTVRHLQPRAELETPNGKVWGVISGLELASHDRVVIADDDVRYDEEGLARIVGLLDRFEVVRPQNYFQPRPWHALWDTGRSLLNRVSGGDWPGTLALRRSALPGGTYDGACLFENLELVRTIEAAGGRAGVAADLFVRRLPSTSAHFWSQRIRQAYDEFARPGRLLFQLSWLPVQLLLLRRDFRTVLLLHLAVIALAEAGRRRSGGTAVFPMIAAAMAPFWFIERSLCAWFAVASRVLQGGVRYRGGVIRKAATPRSELEARFGPHSRKAPARL